MKFVIQFRAVPRSDVVDEFRPHFSVTTLHSNWSDLETQAERRIRKNPNHP
jgi:hypothetical protein